jgi:hypothetical protein
MEEGLVKKKLRALTPKDLGLIDGTKLSKSYNNTHDNYKVVENYVMGFYVLGGQPVRIAPIYQATIYYVHKKTRHFATSHEVGAYFNPPRAHDEEPDTDGDALARLAAIALGALEHHAARNRLAVVPTKKRRNGRRTLP